MAQLVNITAGTPDAVQVWGFYDSCTVQDVKKALTTIAKALSGDNNTIHIMSGTHGYCDGQIGAVATREQKFAEEDRSLEPPKTKDGKPVKVDVHDFNNGSLTEPDPVTAAMAKLNQDMKRIVRNSKDNNIFLLAYCCSAGTK